MKRCLYRAKSPNFLQPKPDLLPSQAGSTTAHHFTLFDAGQERADACSEEGLAICNQYMFEHEPRMWRPALMYWAAAHGAELGFRDLFHALQRYVQDVGKRWAICVRVKGGMEDTSQPGAFCRDQAGALRERERQRERRITSPASQCTRVRPAGCLTA